ncbi:MAG TPA: MBL fold metallo-hydrolase, partial [Mycoplana sp.]|nr:MBL fold metallo-hydrolase [Mycoplana sp.]
MPVRFIAPLVLYCILALVSPTHAQEPAKPASQCQMIAQALPEAVFASVRSGEPASVQSDGTVDITYIGHSTFFIETPGGVTIATDYNGWYKPPSLPTVVTMNRAHSSHYTLAPDPGIAHVLHGWRDDGGLTMGAESMSRVVERVRSALILPMHRRGPPIANFLSMFDE